MTDLQRGYMSIRKLGADMSKSALPVQGASPEYEPCPDLAKKHRNQSSPPSSPKQAAKARKVAEGSLAAHLEVF